MFAGGLLARGGLFDVEYAPIYQASIFVLACVCVFCAGIYALVKKPKKVFSAIAVVLTGFYIGAALFGFYFMYGALDKYNRITQRYDDLMAKVEAGDAEASKKIGGEWGIGMVWFAGNTVQIPEDTADVGKRELLKISKKYSAFVLSQAEKGNEDFAGAALEAHAATKDGRYLSPVEQMAEKGGIRTLMLLCNYYLNGNPTEENKARLFYWAGKLAESGDEEFRPDGYILMADLYATGVNFPEDEAKAVEPYKKGGLADEDIGERMRLNRAANAEWYFLGKYGLPKDEGRAMELLRKSGMPEEDIKQRVEFYRGMPGGGSRE